MARFEPKTLQLAIYFQKHVKIVFPELFGHYKNLAAKNTALQQMQKIEKIHLQLWARGMWFPGLL